MISFYSTKPLDTAQKAHYNDVVSLMTHSQRAPNERVFLFSCLPLVSNEPRFTVIIDWFPATAAEFWQALQMHLVHLAVFDWLFKLVRSFQKL